MNEALIVSILVITIRAGTSLLYGTLGEIYTERSGILNLGVEGIMVMGAATAFAVAYYSGSAWVGLAAAAAIGGLLSVIHAFLTISLRAEQVVSGLALTIFGIGLAAFMGQRLGPGGTTMVGLQGPSFQRIPLPVLSSLPIIGPSIFNQDVMTYMLYLLVPVLSFYLYRTQAGLNLRAVGENPTASDAMGVNVTNVRYLYTIAGGMLMGMAGSNRRRRFQSSLLEQLMQQLLVWIVGFGLIPFDQHLLPPRFAEHRQLSNRQVRMIGNALQQRLKMFCHAGDGSLIEQIGVVLQSSREGIAHTEHHQSQVESRALLA
jgi:ABC-type uncharacterized transport system permease subunit